MVVVNSKIYGNMTPHPRHFHVVFDVASCLLNLSNVVYVTTCFTGFHLDLLAHFSYNKRVVFVLSVLEF